MKRDPRSGRNAVIADWLISAILLSWPLVAGLIVVYIGPGTLKFWNWETASWSTIGSIFSGAGLIFFAYRSWRFQMIQLAQQDRSLRAQTYSTIQGRVIDVNKFLVANQLKVAAIKVPYPLPTSGPPGALPIPAIVDPETEAFADVILSLFEELYYQYNEYHLVNEEIWESWRQLMRTFMREHEYLQGRLQSQGTHLSKPFREFLLQSLTR